MKKLLVLMMLFASAVQGTEIYTNDSLGWLQNGTPIKNSENRKSVQGFGAALLVTSDQDWQKKWETSSDTVPKFTEVNEIRTGAKATILIFFSNPLVAKNSEVDVTCDIKILRPNGRNREYAGLKAMKGKLPGKATYTYLAEPVIAFVSEEQDPLGVWKVEVTIHDQNRRVSVPLRTQFTLVKR